MKEFAELKLLQVALDQAEGAVNDARVAVTLANMLSADGMDALNADCDTATEAIWRLQETVQQALLLIKA